MLLYDVSNEQSFLNVRKWVSDIQEQTDCDSVKLPLIIVGNKIDLRPENEEQRKLFVSFVDGLHMATDCEATFVESSVRSGEHVMQALGTLVLQMIDNENEMVRNNGISLSSRQKLRFLSCCSR